MAEYISREAAFNTILKLVPKVDEDGYCWVIRGDAAKAVDSIPSADVQPVRHGRWIKKHDDVCYWHECSECGINPPKDQWKNEWKSPYCHNCGAKMQGDANE